MKYFHVDVFSKEPMKGNGLTVVFPQKNIDDRVMLKITQEFRQFETVFVFPEKKGSHPVRIFTVEEELAFAGHPLVGAAAVIHHQMSTSGVNQDISLALSGRRVSLKSEKNNNSYRVIMNQGKPLFINTLEKSAYMDILSALNLTTDDLHPGYPVEVVSTGLPYLLLPLDRCVDRVKIKTDDFEKLLSEVNAKFVYVFDTETLECRTWDNSGLVEDVATGSAAGPLCAYLVKNGFRSYDERILVNQGKFVQRPGVITGRVSKDTGEVFIEGDVAFFAQGEVFYKSYFP